MESYCLVPNHLPASVLLKQGQDETRAGITQQADILLKEHVVINLQALHQSSKVQCETYRCKKSFSNFFDLLYLVWLFRHKITIKKLFLAMERD